MSASEVSASESSPLLQVEEVRKTFVMSRRGRTSHRVAADGVSLEIAAGDALGIVGESGCGKTTLANMIMGLERPDSGEIRFRGVPIAGPRSRFPYGEIQIVFQDPRSSLDPRMTVRAMLREPLRALDRSRRDRYGSEEELRSLVTRVGLRPEHLDRRSHQFSGGQRQRIAIARALNTRPSLIVLDEPTSALDVSIQAQILNLLRELQDEYQLTYIFISHDLSVVRHLCDRVVVLAEGRVVESGDTAQVFGSPQAEHTKALLQAAPVLSVGP